MSLSRFVPDFLQALVLEKDQRDQRRRSVGFAKHVERVPQQEAACRRLRFGIWSMFGANLAHKQGRR